MKALPRIAALGLLLIFIALPLFAAVTQIDLTSQVKGLLPATNGGTGISSTATFPASGTIAITSQLPLFTDNETPSGTIDGSNATFTTANACTNLHLYKNGQRMTSGGSNDYTYSSSTITFTSGAKPKSGDVLLDDCQR